VQHREQVSFVTGGGSGIGKAVCLRLAREGAAVAIADLDGDRAQATADEIVAAGGQAAAYAMDVRERPEIQRARDGAVAAFGRVTQLVNCAGLVTMHSLDELTEDDWDLVLDVNLKGMWLVTQEVSKAIAEAGGGAIVNLSTIEAEIVVSSRGYCQVHYNASKGGVKMLTKARAVELSRKQIRVNAVAPGPIATDFVSYEGITSPEAWEYMEPRLLVKRVGQPDDVAAAVSFLLSDDAQWVTGTQLAVDGGWMTQ
jgi:NAD(P)-dependent dehydrogenase (short-subunit alcohol dehydrogenase family)